MHVPVAAEVMKNVKYAGGNWLCKMKKMPIYNNEKVQF
jgi:hypothetical protein